MGHEHHIHQELSPEELKHSLRVLNEVLSPLMHHSDQVTHEEVLVLCRRILMAEPELIDRLVDMFTSFIAVMSALSNYEQPCDYLHEVIQRYEQGLAGLN